MVELLDYRPFSLHIPLQQTTATADFSEVDLHRMMRTDGSAERFTRLDLHTWLAWVNVNATRCMQQLAASSRVHRLDTPVAVQKVRLYTA